MTKKSATRTQKISPLLIDDDDIDFRQFSRSCRDILFKSTSREISGKKTAKFELIFHRGLSRYCSRLLDVTQRSPLNDETNFLLALSPLIPIFASSVDLFHLLKSLLKFPSICISPQSFCLIAFSPTDPAPYGALLFLTDKFKVTKFCLLNIYMHGDWNKTIWYRAGLWCHPFVWSKGGWTNERAEGFLFQCYDFW